MTTLAIERVLALPDPLTANTLYIVTDGAGENMYLVATGTTATVKYRTYNQVDIQNIVDTAIAEGGFYVDGGDLGTPSAGNLSNCTVDGTVKVGYRNIPQNLQVAAYTCVLTDDGKHIFQDSSNGVTIPANSAVAFPIGAAITILAGANQINIAINSDVMRLAGAGTTGTRTLAAYGMATAIKVKATEWRISGAGLS